MRPHTGEVFPYNPGVVPSKHVDFLARLPMIYTDEHRVYVHAGVDAAVSLAEQNPDVLTLKIYPDGEPGGHGTRHVVHGHHQLDDGPPYVWLADQSRCRELAHWPSRHRRI
jgi:hypothetical protein